MALAELEAERLNAIELVLRCRSIERGRELAYAPGDK